jgi:hypothetical protein
MGVGIAQAQAPQAASGNPPSSIHIVQQTRNNGIVGLLQASHDICVQLHPENTSPMDPKMVELAITSQTEDFFAGGRHARYITGRDVELDQGSCKLVDKGPRASVKIEDGEYRIEADLVKNRGSKRPMNLPAAQAATMAAALTPITSQLVEQAKNNPGGGQHLQFAGQPCTTVAPLKGTLLCRWDTLPYYPLGHGHKALVEIMTEFEGKEAGQPVRHTEATLFRIGEKIPDEKFAAPAGVKLAGG